MIDDGDTNVIAGQVQSSVSGGQEESGQVPPADTDPEETEEAPNVASAPDTSSETAAPVTEPVTVPATEVTVAETEPETEPAIDPLTEPVTEPITEATTPIYTEPATEPLTEPVTDPLTEPLSDAPGTASPEPPQSPVLMSGETLVESRDYLLNEGRRNEAILRISIVEKNGIYGNRRAAIELLNREGELLDSSFTRVSGIAFVCIIKNPGGGDSIAVFIANPKPSDPLSSASFMYISAMISDTDLKGTPLPGLRIVKDTGTSESVSVSFGTPADEKGFELKFETFMARMKHAWENYYGSDLVCRLDQGGWNLYDRGQEPLRKEAVEAITGMEISDLKYWNKKKKGVVKKLASRVCQQPVE